MTEESNSILLIGESDVGKTHYGAQLLKRLMKGDGKICMDGAATNLEPFEAAMECLNAGKAASHTATSTYVESVWPISDTRGTKAQLVWPDYGGEQIKAVSSKRRISSAWRARVLSSPAWLLLIRLQKTLVSDDIFSRPLSELKGASNDNREVQISDQARLIELLQMLVYVRGEIRRDQLLKPRLCILLSCWDELQSDTRPFVVLEQRLPMLASFVASTWKEPAVLGLSALGRPLSIDSVDAEFAKRGPEQFGYIVLPDSDRSPDLTLPIQILLAGSV
jgi:Double-GTPase 1